MNVDKIRDYYLRIRAEDAGRLRYNDMRDKLWPSRTRRPRRPDNTPFYEWVPYETQRYSEAYEIDHREESQAEFGLSKHHAFIRVKLGSRNRRWRRIIAFILSFEEFRLDTTTGLGGAHLRCFFVFDLFELIGADLIRDHALFHLDRVCPDAGSKPMANNALV